MATNVYTDPKDATTTYTQPSVTPTSKVKAAGLAGVGGTLIITILGLLGVELPAEVAAAIVTLLAFGAGYLKKSDTANGADKKEIV
jgi:hypothetical protein